MPQMCKQSTAEFEGNLLCSVDLLLELLTVAEGVVHVVVDHALQALIFAQVPLIVPQS